MLVLSVHYQEFKLIIQAFGYEACQCMSRINESLREFIGWTTDASIITEFLFSIRKLILLTTIWLVDYKLPISSMSYFNNEWTPK